MSGALVSISPVTCDNVSEAARWWNTERLLTHPPAVTGRGLAMKATRICSAETCERAVHCKGLCRAHYCASRYQPHPRRSAEDRFWAKVNKTTSCWFWMGTLNNKGYGGFSVGGRGALRRVYAHRFAYELLVGPIAPGLEVDHTCHQPACVNPDHLNPVTHKENVENLAGAKRNSKSGVRGVWWHAKTGMWFVQATSNRVRYSGGYYHTLAEAEAAAIALRNRLHTNNLADRVAS